MLLKVGEVFSEIGDFFISFDESLRENGFYELASPNYALNNTSMYNRSNNDSNLLNSNKAIPNDSSAKSKLSNSDIQNRQNDRRLYFQIETNLIKAINGDDTSTSPNTYRQRMRNLREKWEKRDAGWEKSRYE